jgi:hypothetical protein
MQKSAENQYILKEAARIYANSSILTRDVVEQVYERAEAPLPHPL